MLRVGLTGGIGCGKSAVAAMMGDLGCHVLDADRIAHQVIEPGQPAYGEIFREFGDTVLASGGRIDRARLASIVFSDSARLARLNAIVHPRVRETTDRELQRLAKSDPHGIAVVEAALTVESGSYKRLDCLVVVWCTPEQQLERLTNPRFGRGMAREQAERRMASQLSLAEKRKVADYEIDASGTVEETRQQVAALVEKLRSRSKAV